MGFFKVESSDWQEARPGRVPIKRYGDASLPFAARDMGLAQRGQGVESHLAGSGEGGPGSSQRYLKDEKQLTYNTVSVMVFTFIFPHSCNTSSQLGAWWRGPGCWRSSGRTQLVMGEQVVQL